MKNLALLAFLLALPVFAQQSQTATQTFTITSVGQLVIPSQALPPAIQTAAGWQPYSYQIVVTGGVAPYTFKVTSGSFWPGVTLNANGTINGTPTGPCTGTCAVSVSVTDSTP